MSEPLYNRDILRLAASTAGLERLDAPDASIERRSPVCGSRVTVDVTMREGSVSAFGASVNACAFGQASTALLAQTIVGRTGAELVQALSELRDYLHGKRPDPGLWPQLGLFERARAHPGRHGAILLPFEAATEAVDCIEGGVSGAR